MKTDVDRLYWVLIMEKKNYPIYFSKIELFFNFETKSSLSMFVFFFFTISQIKKKIVYVLWIQTCRNVKSIKFANFLSITCP